MRLRPLALASLFLAACAPLGMAPTRTIRVPGPSMSPTPAADVPLMPASLPPRTPAPGPTEDPRRLAIAGKVYDAAGKPLAAAKVKAVAADQGTALHIARSRAENAVNWP